MTACGSPCYAAPELIKGLEYIGPKADIWSAGVVLYCLVCGHLPFEDQNTQSLYQKILSTDYQFTCYLSDEVKNLIEHVLVAEPELRFGLKQIKQNSWFKSYTSSLPKPEFDKDERIPVHRKLLREMKDECDQIDINFTRGCLEANVKNSLTAYYHLLVKKKTNLQESMSDLPVKANGKNLIPIPGGKQVREHHSIPAAPRHNIGNLDRMRQAGYQMKKMEEGLNNITLQNQIDKFKLIEENDVQSTSDLPQYTNHNSIQMKKNPQLKKNKNQTKNVKTTQEGYPTALKNQMSD